VAVWWLAEVLDEYPGADADVATHGRKCMSLTAASAWFTVGDRRAERSARRGPFGGLAKPPVPDSLDQMGWTSARQGLELVLFQTYATLIESQLADDMTGFLKSMGDAIRNRSHG